MLLIRGNLVVLSALIGVTVVASLICVSMRSMVTSTPLALWSIAHIGTVMSSYFYCQFCKRKIPMNDDGLIIHDDVYHPANWNLVDYSVREIFNADFSFSVGVTRW